MSIPSGKLSKDWKSSLVVPIPKKGDHSDPFIYHPIPLLPVLSISQWGFLPGRSTTHAVLSATHEWHQTLYSGSEVCSIFFNLQKAFDSVPHRSLIAKLSLLNISDFLLKWIIDYLTDRGQYVGVEGATSPPLPVLCGVPQGSVLGPLLFKIYIDGHNNVPSNCSMHLYADDRLPYRPIPSPTDYQAVQADIDALSDCAPVRLCPERGIPPCQLHYWSTAKI